MKVLDHEPCSWFLLENQDALLLDANCNHSFVGYDFLIQLTPGEIDEYLRRGRAYLDWLSGDIQNSAPILIGSKSVYKGRDLSSAHREQVNTAIDAWRYGSIGTAT